jgi:hypothetical protein
MAMTTEEKAKKFDQLLLEHDKLSRELSIINSKFDLTGDDHKIIKELKFKMDSLLKQASLLGSY